MILSFCSCVKKLFAFAIIIFLQCISQPTPLQKVVQEIRLEAQQKGLTPKILEEILKDD